MAPYPLPLLDRRGFLAGLATLPAVETRGGAEPSPPPAFADNAKLLVGGPANGPTDRWAQLLAPLLSRALSLGAPIQREPVGGADGVTAANQFEARTMPDGTTALLLPGAAALDWLVGDPRARFDAAHWVPTMAGVGSGIMVGRALVAALPRGAKLRVGASGPTGPELPALLAVDLLGLQLVPVFGLDSDGAARDALAQGAVDAIFLGGRNVAARLPPVQAIGAAPLFSLGVTDESGGWTRDPAFPSLATVAELQAARGLSAQGPLSEAWRAAAAAVQLDVALVLPLLTPAAIVAMWRRACSHVAGAPELLSAASGLGVRAQGTPAATASTQAVAANAAALLELRRWLATRFNWQPA
jgi:hypothetical protein